MTTIDHAAEARDALTTAHDFAGDEEFAFADLTLKAAQVHATLALVEQQRIANLIDLARAPRATILGEQPANDALQGLAEFREHEPAELGGWYELRPNIKKGLWL